MTDCSHGDIVLVSFVFSDASGIKRRPALVLSTDHYHQNRQEAIVAAVTSNINRLLTGDHKIKNWRQSGLLYPSVVTGIIRTVKQNMVSRQIGTLSSTDLHDVKRKLRESLDL